ncbi:hypothetical protein Anas_07505 [Armadillidium nasatum]|uniref:Uncharacterized protein n=1 Tax=Armadillidium nasatum TaxID=96803 RepID=A0A5N5SUI9_9CRUS|nr:hypothetical protein Anas_07505 [Armadillidium nasatum]
MKKRVLVLWTDRMLLFVIGGESCGRILGNIECSSMENFSWLCSLPRLKEPKGREYVEGQEVIRPLKYPRSNAAVACKNNIIYIIVIGSSCFAEL